MTLSRASSVLFLVCAVFACVGMAGAEEVAAAAEPVIHEVDTGTNAWMLVSCALVLMMTAPGLALFYGGLVRQKNVLSTMMHSVFLMGLMSILWMVYGYSMAFGTPLDGFLGSIIGNPTEHLFLQGVSPHPSEAGGLSPVTFMLFQMMFAIITPALISGAYAERVKFSAMVLFTILWGTIVYFPMAHMVWGSGGLFAWEGGNPTIPALDFAGGTVVHISSGISALVFALILGKRKGYGKEPMRPHNLVFTMIGAALLWVGWFGFNAGSALSAGASASQAFATTHFASAAGALAWACLEWIKQGKPSALGTVSGLVAGLVGVTPAAGFVSIPAAALIGLIAGVVCFFAVTKIKIALGYDDSLDAFGVHGVGGTVGALLTGVFASAAVNGGIAEVEVQGKTVSLVGSGAQFVNQLLSVVVTMALAGIATFVILKVVDAVIGLRVTDQEELEGLDTTQHGEEAYTGTLGGGLLAGGGEHASLTHTAAAATPKLASEGAE